MLVINIGRTRYDNVLGMSGFASLVQVGSEWDKSGNFSVGQNVLKSDLNSLKMY